MSKKCSRTICFVHYGIGWKDGVNMAFKTLAQEIKKKEPSLNFCFLGGVIKERFLKPALYKVIPELLPKRTKLTKDYIQKKSKIIAKKLAKNTEAMEVVVIENPFLGSYNLPAMLGYSLYASCQKPKGTKVFFRIHDFYKDFPRYSKELQKIFSPQEIKEITNGKGVDGFLIINRRLREKLIKEGVSKEKIFYLPNGINEKIFNKPLTKKEERLICQSLKIPPQKTKKSKILLYPVRIIPRKNIEEAILLTALIRKITKENYILIISGKVDKNDPLSKTYYTRLKKLKRLASFPIIFTKNRIKKFNIGDLYQISEAILMTSRKEGFGYPFLECWFARKIVIGRRIEEVIRDFEKSGLRFWWLYRQFSIPALIKQIELLQNRKKQKQIIVANLKAARKVYKISKVSKNFLKLVGLK